MTKRFLQALFLGGLILSLGLFLGGCPQPTDNNGAAQDAAEFKSGQKDILALTEGTVQVVNEAAVDAALAAYEGLSEDAQALLSNEKTHLDGLKAKIASLKDAPVSGEALDLSGLITAPVKDAAPFAAAIDTAHYTGTVAWKNSAGAAFAGAAFAPATVYKAVITLTAKPGHTFDGVGANSFVYTGATATNAAGSGVVTLTFPATAGAEAPPAPVNALNLTALITAPARDAAPVTAAIDAGQYTGAIAWQIGEAAFTGEAFAPATVYKAVITLTAKPGYTLEGVGANSFAYTGATVTNAADNGVVTIVFPATADAVVHDLDLTALVTAPAKGATPVTELDDPQYTGAIAWRTINGVALSGAFAPATVYRAVVTLTAKPGHTLAGVAANSFAHDGASSIANPANSGVVTIVFPATAGAMVDALDLTALITAPAKSAAPVKSISPAQYTGTIQWQTGGTAFDGTAFEPDTAYTAIVTLAAKPGYTLEGLTADSFTYTGATSITNTAEGVVTISFPATAPVEVVNALDLSSLVRAPVKGAVPVKNINQSQYTGTVAWQTGDGAAFDGPVFNVSTAYTAIVALTAKVGYTLEGLAANSFAHSDASTAPTNGANSGVVTIAFPATAAVETVNALDLSGLVTAPAKLAAPAAASINVSQYTGTIQWQNDDGTAFTGVAFDVSTVYKAVVTLTAKVGYHLTGVAANSFIYDGATVTNAENSGVVTITFPATADPVVHDLDLSLLVTAPVKDEAPVATPIDGTQYVGLIAWQTEDGALFDGAAFAPNTIYKAVATLTAKSGYTFAGLAANSFTHTGATSVANAANSGVVTITFPVTAPAVVDALDLTALITAPVKDAVPDTMAIDENQYTGTIAWQTEDSAPFTGPAFAPVTVYKAVATLTAKLGYTFAGLEADSFVHTGAATISNAADSGTVTITFPATAIHLPTITRAMITVPAGTVSEGKAWSSNKGTPKWPLPQTFPAFKIGATEVVYDLWHEVYQWATSAERGENIYTFAYPGQEGTQMSGGQPGFLTEGGATPSSRRYEPVTWVHWRGAVVWCNAYTEWSNAVQGTSLTPVYYEDEGYETILRVAESASRSGNGKADNAFLKPNANGYRLPTMGEWEYAGRGADPDSEVWDYACPGSNTPGDVAWYSANSGNTTHDVASKAPNTLGLYDMGGNVAEFCQDKASSSARATRGGKCDSSEQDIRFITMGSYSIQFTTVDIHGFRVAASISD